MMSPSPSLHNAAPPGRGSPGGQPPLAGQQLRGCCCCPGASAPANSPRGPRGPPRQLRSPHAAQPPAPPSPPRARTRMQRRGSSRLGSRAHQPAVQVSTCYGVPPAPPLSSPAHLSDRVADAQTLHVRHGSGARPVVDHAAALHEHRDSVDESPDLPRAGTVERRVDMRRNVAPHAVPLAEPHLGPRLVEDCNDSHARRSNRLERSNEVKSRSGVEARRGLCSEGRANTEVASFKQRRASHAAQSAPPPPHHPG